MRLSNILATAALLLLAGTATAGTLGICHGEYALCAASSTEPTGRTILVNGKVFLEGKAVCPVLTGDSIADLNLMNGSCAAPEGKVWSLFSEQSSYPQAPTWQVAPAQFRSFTTSHTKGGGMSNMWSFLCDKQPQPVNGVTLADCYGPINESPWTDVRVPAGATAFTQAPVGAANPVGGNMPILLQYSNRQ
jgi:hypothetical protein